MGARRVVIVSVLALVALASGLGVGAGETSGRSRPLGDGRDRLSLVAALPAAVQPVVRTDSDRLDGGASFRKSLTTRLLVVGLAALSGLGLLWPAARRRLVGGCARTTVSRVRLVVGLRAPPAAAVVTAFRPRRPSTQAA